LPFIRRQVIGCADNGIEKIDSFWKIYNNVSLVEKNYEGYFMKKFVLFMIILMAGSSFAKSDIPKEARDAFRSGSYVQAITEFKKVLASNPNDSTALKYSGLSYVKLGNLRKAIELLKRAKQASPSNGSICYYLAEAYYLAGEYDLSKDEILSIYEKFPTNIYTQKAQLLEKRISDKYRRRKLRFYLRESFQYDSNVALEPQKKGIKGFDKDSSRFATYTWVELAPIQLKEFDFGVSGSFYQSLHTEHDSKRYNLSSFEFGPFISHTIPLFGHDLVSRLEYSYIQDILNGESFSRTHRIHFRTSSYLMDWLYIALFYQIDFDDFFYRGRPSDNDILNRDAVQTQGGFRSRIHIANKRYVYFGYDYTNNDSEGANWNYDRNRVFAEFVTPTFVPKLDLYLLGEYYNRYFSPYRGSYYNSKSNRDENAYSFRVKTRYSFTSRSSLETSFRYVKKESTIEEEFEYERSIFDLSYVYKF